MSALDRLLDERALVVCVGPGGVGKTTVSAALALRAAERGRRALVLTIDPARRLADALGLDGLDDRVREVDVDLAGSLSAAMLDTRTSFDALIARVAADDDARDRILGNPVYLAFSRTLARSHAYVAMERLYDVVEHGEFDLVVLDTPPTRSALDVLDAPGRLARFVEGRVVRWFLSAPSGGGSLPRGGAAALKLLQVAVGESVVSELVGFLGALAHLREGFERRAHRTSEILVEATTAFVLVTEPHPTGLHDAAYLRDGLAERGVRVEAVLFNRAYEPEPGALEEPVHAPGPPPDARGELRELTARLRALRLSAVARNDEARAAMARFVERVPPEAVVLAAPRLEWDVLDLGGLARLFRPLAPAG